MTHQRDTLSPDPAAHAEDAHANSAALARRYKRERDMLLQACKETVDWLESFSVPPTSTIEEKEQSLELLRATISTIKD